MTAATLNGRDRLELPGGETVIAESDEDMRHVTLKLDRAGEHIWSSGPLELGPEPTRRLSTSRSADYLAVPWPDVGGLAVLGDSSAVVVNVGTGSVIASFSLKFTGKESLEQVGLDVTADGRFLIITSTKRLWVVDRGLQPALRYEPRFLFAGLPAFEADQIVIAEYDFDSDQEVVTQILEL